MASFPADCLPPEGTYASREELFKAINRWAVSRGYAFTTGKSKLTSSRRRIVFYSCDRSRRPPSPSDQRQRNTTTRSTLCPFSVLAKESLDKSMWTLTHRPDPQFSIHNHQPSHHISAYPIHRTLSTEDIAIMTSFVEVGIRPKQIRIYLRENSTSIATQQDIYNQITNIRRENYRSQSSIHVLANQLEDEGF